MASRYTNMLKALDEHKAMKSATRELLVSLFSEVGTVEGMYSCAGKRQVKRVMALFPGLREKLEAVKVE